MKADRSARSRFVSWLARLAPAHRSSEKPQPRRPRELFPQYSRHFYHWRPSFSFGLRGSDLHPIAQIHDSRKRHFVSLGQPRKHLIFIGAGDSYLNIPPVHRVAVVGKDEMLSLVVTHGATRNYQH